MESDTLLYTSEVISTFSEIFFGVLLVMINHLIAKNLPMGFFSKFLQRNDGLYFAWIDLF